MIVKDSERGFTLLEVLMASVLGGLLIIAAFGMLYDSIGIADVLRSRAQLNAAARESFDILLDGGVSNNVLDGGVSNNVDVYGLRGRAAAPLPAALNDIANNNYRVRLQDDITTPPTVALSGSTVVTHTVSCTAIGDPLPACILGNENLAINGFLGGEPRVFSAARVVSNRTREIEITLANPYLLNRPDATTAQSVEIYRTIFMLNGD